MFLPIIGLFVGHRVCDLCSSGTIVFDGRTLGGGGGRGSARGHCSLTADSDFKHIDRILCQSAIESIVRER